MQKRTIIAILILLPAFSMAAAQPLERIEPPFWWAGMVNPELQLMLYGDGIADYRVSLGDAPGVRLNQVVHLENRNHLIVDLNLSPDAAPGSIELHFSKGGTRIFSTTYELRRRRAGSAGRRGFDAADVVYLITPDRFANGDPGNDHMPGMLEAPDRANRGGRHGGDIQGIVDHLDYIRDMGFTAIWINPLLENNMPRYSYHGYATTDFYRVDPRFGSNASYRALSRRAAEKGIKLIMDMIVNHCGTEHWWIKDPPAPDWINFQAEFPRGKQQFTNHEKATLQDPYAAPGDVRQFTDGWFVDTMPDLNQRNPHLATYLIQNAIWWIEFADLAGIRMDTYPYADRDFMRNWSCAVMAEYPNFNIVGEEWSGNPAIVAQWQSGKFNADGYTSCLPGLMDFPLQEGLIAALNGRDAGSPWRPLYRMLANDFLYADPSHMVVFPDNHDIPRFFALINEDLASYKLGIAYLLTVRGIPQIYYGTEILMSSPRQRNDGIIRSDFPGGWPGDQANAFTGAGLTPRQREAQAYFKKLLNWRRQKAVVHEGKLMHFLPRDGVYVLFRYDDSDKVMVVLNKKYEAVELGLSRFREILGPATQGKDVISGERVELGENLAVPAAAPMVIEVER